MLPLFRRCFLGSGRRSQHQCHAGVRMQRVHFGAHARCPGLLAGSALVLDRATGTFDQARIIKLPEDQPSSDLTTYTSMGSMLAASSRSETCLFRRFGNLLASRGAGWKASGTRTLSCTRLTYSH